MVTCDLFAIAEYITVVCKFAACSALRFMLIMTFFIEFWSALPCYVDTIKLY